MKLFVTEKYITYFVVSTLICIFILIFTDYIYVQFDAYYYASLADSLSAGHGLMDYTKLPAVGVRTPQNAIVFLQLLLMKLGISDIHTRLVVLAILNSFAISISAVIVNKITVAIGMDKKTAWLIGMTIPVSFYYQMVLMQGINDALLIALSFYVLWLTFKNNLSRKDNYLSLLIALIIDHFRLVGVFAFVPGVFSHLVKRKYRMAGFYLLCIILSVVSVVLFSMYLHVDLSGIQRRSSDIESSYSAAFFFHHLIKTLELSIPEALLRTTYFTAGFTITNPVIGILVSIGVISIVAYSVYKAVGEKNWIIIWLTLYIGLFLIFFQMHPAQPTRYLINISMLLPLFFLYAFKDKYRLKAAVIMFILSIAMSTAQFATTGLYRYGQLKKIFSQNLAQGFGNISYHLISYFPRETYFLLGKRSETDILQHEEKDHEPIVLIGPTQFIKYYLYQYRIRFRGGKYSVVELKAKYPGYEESANSPYYFPYKNVMIHAFVILPKK